jgi:hypothetical protein
VKRSVMKERTISGLALCEGGSLQLEAQPEAAHTAFTIAAGRR